MVLFKKFTRTSSSFLVPFVLAGLMSGCASLAQWGFIDKSNLTPPTPLTKFQPRENLTPLWSTQANSGIGAHDNALPLIFSNGILYANDRKGNVVAVNVSNGRLLWTQHTKSAIASGPSVADGIVAVTTQDAHLFVFDATSGHKLWSVVLPTIAQGAPAISQKWVAVKTLDGHISIYSRSQGALIWQNQHQVPSFSVLGDSAPVFAQNQLVAGYADGHLVAMHVSTQRLMWDLPIAMPGGTSETAQMVGIVAAPIIQGGAVYAISYQGNLAAVSLSNGTPLWSIPMSSQHDMSFAGGRLFITDASGNVIAINASNGTIVWQQDQLANRGLTPPALVPSLNALAVADAEGYLHILSQSDGHLLARTKVSKSPILAAPVAVGKQIYLLTQSGQVIAYKVAAHG